MSMDSLKAHIRRQEVMIRSLRREIFKLKIELGRLITVLKEKPKKKKERELTDKEIELLLSGKTEEDEKEYCLCCGEELDEDHAKQESKTCSNFCWNYYYGSDKLTPLGKKIVRESGKKFKRKNGSEW